MNDMTENQTTENQVDSLGGAADHKEPTYGDMLRDKREQRGFSIDQVASQLRVSTTQIEGLENCNPKVFPSPVYARAHLRSYAKLLGVDEAKVAALFNETLQAEEKDQRAFINKTTSGLAPYKDVTPKNKSGKLTAGILFVAVLAAVGYMAYSYFGGNYDLNSIKEKVTAPVEKVSDNQTTNKAVLPIEEKKPAAAEQAPAASQPAAKAEEPTAAQKKEQEAAKKPEKPASQPEAKEAPKTAAAEAAAVKEPVKAEEKAAEAKEPAKEVKAAEAPKEVKEAKVEKQETSAAEAADKAKAEGKKDSAEALKNLKNPLAIKQTPDNAFELQVPAVQGGEVDVRFIAKDGGEAWFGVYEEGKLVRSATLKDGQTKDFKQNLPCRITVGNRFSGSVIINGHPINIENNHRNVASSFTVLAE